MAAGCQSSSFQWITHFSQDDGVKGVGLRWRTSGRSAHDRSWPRQWCNSIRSPINSVVRVLRRSPAKFTERRSSPVNDTFDKAIFILGRQRRKQIGRGGPAIGGSILVNRQSVVRLGI